MEDSTKEMAKDLQAKNAKIMELQAALSSKNGEIMNLRFSLMLKNGQLKQTHRAFTEAQKVNTVYMTKLKLTTRKLQEASSQNKKHALKHAKLKVSSGLEISQLKSLLTNKDSQLDSVQSVKKSEKSAVKPASVAVPKIEQIESEEKRSITRRLFGGSDYEDLLVRMEEGFLWGDFKPAVVNEESPLNIASVQKESSKISDVHKESPLKISSVLKESFKVCEVLNESSSNNFLKESTPPLSIEEDKKPFKQTMGDLGIFGEVEPEASSYEDSLTTKQLENTEGFEEVDPLIDLLTMMEEGLLPPRC